MKFSLARNLFLAVALSTVVTAGSAQAQLTGGQVTGTGNAFGAAPTTGAAGGAANNKLPGSFGGPGITGASRLELSNINPSTAFNNGQSVSGATTGTTGGTTGLAGQTSGGSAFGNNAFSNSTTTGNTGGFGGGQGGGLGGGLGGGFGGGRLGGLGGIGGLGGLGGGLGGGNSNANAKKQIRPIVRPDIEFERESPSTNAANAQRRLTRIQLPKKLQGVTSSVDGEVVVLRGTVSTESDRTMVERLVKLEPGIDSVRNEVRVQTNQPERIRATPNR